MRAARRTVGRSRAERLRGWAGWTVPLFLLVLFLVLLLALIQQRFGLVPVALVPLVGVYPTFGLLALATLGLSLLPAWRRGPPFPAAPAALHPRRSPWAQGAGANNRAGGLGPHL